MFLQITIEKSNRFDGWTHRLGAEATVARDTWRQMMRTDEILNPLCAETIAAPRHAKELRVMKKGYVVIETLSFHISTAFYSILQLLIQPSLMAGAHQLVCFLDLTGGVAERIGSGVSSRKEIKPFGPQEGLPPAPIP